MSDGIGSRGRDSWLDIFRAFGESLLAVLRAELRVISAQFQAWGKSWLIALVLLVLVLFISFWLLGLLSVAAVHGLMVGFDLVLWQAALLGAGLLALLIAILAGGAVLLMRRFESPATVLRGRIDESSDWVRTRILDRPTEAADQLTEGERDEANDSGDRESAPNP